MASTRQPRPSGRISWTAAGHLPAVMQFGSVGDLVTSAGSRTVKDASAVQVARQCRAVGAGALHARSLQAAEGARPGRQLPVSVHGGREAAGVQQGSCRGDHCSHVGVFGCLCRYPRGYPRPAQRPRTVRARTASNGGRQIKLRTVTICAHAPARCHRRNSAYTVRQEPWQSGTSRQGAPTCTRSGRGWNRCGQVKPPRHRWGGHEVSSVEVLSGR
jgi:hypothetical protein